MNKLLKIFKAKAPLTVIGVLLIGIVCSAIYDAVVKPGFSLVSQVLFDLFTFGSQRAKDYTFSNAALDPTSLPSTITMAVVVSVTTAAFVVFNIYHSFESKDLLEDIEKADKRAAEIDEIKKLYRDDPQRLAAEIAALRARRRSAIPDTLPPLNASVKKMFRILGFVSWIFAGVGFIGGWVGVTVANQSLIVWRGFNADMNIIAPYVSPKEMLNLRSKFSQVKTEKDYIAIRVELDAIAKLNNLSLRGAEN